MTFTDPPVPDDGSCAVCGRERKVSGLRPLYRAAMRDDPFCSMEHAREWWGTQLPATARPGRRGYIDTLPPAA